MTVKNLAHGHVVSPRKGKRRVLYNKKRRILWNKLMVSFIIALGFIYGTVTFISQAIQTYPEWRKDQHDKWINKKYEKIEIIIQQGDTAWEIQQELTPHERDLRIPLDLAKKLKENKNVDWGNLKPGQTVVFLKEKRSSD